jgi:hypothetical protein
MDAFAFGMYMFWQNYEKGHFFHNIGKLQGEI